MLFKYYQSTLFCLWQFIPLLFPLSRPYECFYRCAERETGNWSGLKLASEGVGRLVLTKPVLRFGSPHLQDHCPLIDFLSMNVCLRVFPLRGGITRGSSDFWWHLTVNVKLLCLWCTSSPLLFILCCSLPILTGIQKREAVNCRKIRHFENRFAMETLICEQ